MNNKVVYFHRTKEELPRVYYIGCGNKERAYNLKARRSSAWAKVHNEFGTEVVIYDSNLSKEEAYKMEIELIAFFGRQCTGEGFLVNKAIGGKGSNGVKRSAETKAKMSKSQQGKKKPPLTVETKAKMSKAKQGEKCCSSKLTEEIVTEILCQLKFHYYHGIVNDLAKKYGVNPTTITLIKTNRNWKHIDRDTILKKD